MRPARAAPLAWTAASRRASGPLLSRNGTASGKAPVAFAWKAIVQGPPGFLPTTGRLAVFDNNGTPQIEPPRYSRACFTPNQIKALAPRRPVETTKEPFARRPPRRCRIRFGRRRRLRILAPVDGARVCGPPRGLAFGSGARECGIRDGRPGIVRLSEPDSIDDKPPPSLRGGLSQRRPPDARAEAAHAGIELKPGQILHGPLRLTSSHVGSPVPPAKVFLAGSQSIRWRCQ